MGQRTSLQLALLFLVLSPPLCRGQRLSCERCDLQLSCNCSSGGFSRVPSVPDEALSLDLSFNIITVVTDDDLTGLRHLRALSLHSKAGGMLRV